MKRSKWTRIISIAMVALTALSLAACGAAPASTPAPSASSAAPASSAPAESSAPSEQPVTLNMITWVQQTNEDAIAALNAAFSAKYPNVSFTVDTANANDYPTLLQTRIAAGDVDIISNISAFDSLPQDFTKGCDKPAWETFILGGSYLDITDQPFVKNWDPGMIANAVSYNGKVYGLDMGAVGYNGMFYNKKLFDENGLKEPGTWADLENICKTFQGKGIVPVTLGGADGWPLTSIAVSGIVGGTVQDMTAYAKGLWDGSRKFTDDQSMVIWNRMAEFVSWLEPNVTAVAYGDAPGRFVAGKAAMLYDGTWNAGTIAGLDPNFQFGYFAIPGDVDGKPNQLQGKYDMQFNIYANSKNKDWALKYFDFLSQPENYGPFVDKLGFFPTMPGVKVGNAFVNSIADKNTGFKPSWEKTIVPPKGVGVYAVGQCFALNQLKVLGGTVENVTELAKLAQQDWDTAVAAASK